MNSPCSCKICQVGCKTLPGVLSPANLLEIDHKYLVASEGTATVVNTGEKIPSRTIVPAQKPNGHCVFFEGGKCSIHDHKPDGCAIPNTCQPDNKQDYIALAILYQSVNQSEEYQATWEKLRRKKQIARPIKQRYAEFERAIKKATRKEAKKSRT